MTELATELILRSEQSMPYMSGELLASDTEGLKNLIWPFWATSSDA